jgi:hypothetical protein
MGKKKASPKAGKKSADDDPNWDSILDANIDADIDAEIERNKEAEAKKVRNNAAGHAHAARTERMARTGRISEMVGQSNAEREGTPARYQQVPP